jgi:hypothetical protein
VRPSWRRVLISSFGNWLGDCDINVACHRMRILAVMVNRVDVELAAADVAIH